MRQSNRNTLPKVLRYLQRYWWMILMSLVLAIVTVGFTLYIPILIGRAIDFIVDEGVNWARLSPLLRSVAIYALVVAVAQWLMGIFNNKITFQVVRDMRRDAFERISELPLSYLDAHPSGEIVSRVIADVDQFADGLLMGFTQLFTGIVTIGGTLVFMLRMNAGIALVVIVITPLSLFFATFVARKTYSMFLKQSEVRAEQTAIIDEVLGNEKVVKAYGQEAKVLEDFDEVNERLAGYSLRAVFYSSLTNPGTRFVNSIVYAGVALFGAISVVRGNMSVGVLACFLSYANQYTKPFNEISGVVTELQNAFACAARIFGLIEETPQVPEAIPSRELCNVKGEISMENVSFAYDESHPLIENLNVHVKPGEMVAIVGPTGCGKTTIINLLMRFYDVQKGSIRIDGMDIRDVTRKSLRASFGMVLQETWLKSGTIFENIAMGKEDVTREEVIAAAKAAHSHSFIKRLPQGYDTRIEEDGGMLSQGQKQLLCITRVMLLLPPMLILDEATSSIDTRTEIQIQKDFKRLMEGRTTFIVAHRLSTIQSADTILVMKDGHIMEQGKHDELLAQNGFYAKLYNSQFAG